MRIEVAITLNLPGIYVPASLCKPMFQNNQTLSAPLNPLAA
jgi:hypothetical protein